MSDYINRETLMNALDELCDRACVYSKKQRSSMCGACALGGAFDVVEAIPAADVQEKKQTNADRIRSMTDDELASELLSISAWPEKAGALYEVGAFESVWDAMLWWLKQEDDE